MHFYILCCFKNSSFSKPSAAQQIIDKEQLNPYWMVANFIPDFYFTFRKLQYKKWFPHIEGKTLLPVLKQPENRNLRVFRESPCKIATGSNSNHLKSK